MRRLAALALCCSLPLAVAAPTTSGTPDFLICTLDTGFPPLSHPNGSGLAQRAVEQAIVGLPLQLKWTLAPRRRCVAEIQTGRVQAIFAIRNPRYSTVVAYPGGNTRPDARHAAAIVRVRVYRLKGSAAHWDGTRFALLGNRAVGVQSGFGYKDTLVALGVPVDDGAAELKQQFAKLASGRLALVLAIEGEADLLLQGELATRIEALPLPFVDDPLYLVVNQQFYATHREAIDTLWQRLTPRLR
ncbi:hypothetical protein [Chitinolyticbacter meiyuanensis]|uniref:hypothetical protein n=1 Tax=Chitinolyticbacter meiyuanensis TaxID=682798 RepID=UPI0011E5E96C|nr:hypothetical protein [Chitinolyticbacter meiyuanensis]